MLETAKKLLGIPKEPPLQAKMPEAKQNLVKHELLSRIFGSFIQILALHLP